MHSPELTLADMRLVVALADALANDLLSASELAERMSLRKCPIDQNLNAIIPIQNKLNIQSTPLVNTTTAGSRLTHVGKRIADAFKQMVACYDQYVAKGLRPCVRLGATNTISTFLLPEIIKTSPRLRESAYDIDVVEGEGRDLHRKLADRLIDFAIGPKCIHRTHTEIPLCNWKRVLMYSHKHAQYIQLAKIPNKIEPKTNEEAILLGLLSQTTVLVPPPNVLAGIEKWLPEPIDPGRRIQLPQAAIRLAWVRSGIGVGVGHEEQVLAGEDSTEIRTIDLTNVLTYNKQTQMQLYLLKTHGQIVKSILKATRRDQVIDRQALIDEMVGTAENKITPRAPPQRLISSHTKCWNYSFQSGYTATCRNYQIRNNERHSYS